MGHWKFAYSISVEDTAIGNRHMDRRKWIFVNLFAVPVLVVVLR